VAFLQTLTDGFTTRTPTRIKFTGRAWRVFGQRPKGMSSFIPTPASSALASAICDVRACAQSAYPIGPKVGRRIPGGRAERDMEAWGLRRPHARLVFPREQAIGGCPCIDCF